MLLGDKLKIGAISVGFFMYSAILALNWSNTTNRDAREKMVKTVDTAVARDVVLGLSDYGREWLEERGVPRDSSDAYDTRFLGSGENLQHIEWFYGEGITPGIANRFDTPSLNSVDRLNNTGVSPEFFNALNQDIRDDDRLSAGTIYSWQENIGDTGFINELFERFGMMPFERIHKSGVDIDSVLSYDQDAYSTGENVVGAVELGLNPGVANSYPERFSGRERNGLFGGGISPELARQYDGSFSAHKIGLLHSSGVVPRVANSYVRLNEKYDTSIDAEDIVKFSKLEYTFEEVESVVRRSVLEEVVLLGKD